MFLSIEQVRQSLQSLEELHPFFGISLLAFKREGLPIGSTKRVNFSQAADEILNAHFRPVADYGLYQPFRTARKAARWVADRYGSTSLQRITKDTFGDALLHPTQSDWGWRQDYVDVLRRHLRGGLIPAFDLAVWLFRDREWRDGVTPQEVRDALFERYHFSPKERKTLFKTSIPKLATPWLRQERFDDHELLEVIGYPPDYLPQEGVALQSLRLRQIGPTNQFLYEPAERLNIITGDNGLGKTFLLECIWWALTGAWLDEPVLPRPSADKNEPAIGYQVVLGRYRPPAATFSFNWDQQAWESDESTGTRDLQGIAVYARYDGSVAVWDPARTGADKDFGWKSSGRLRFNRKEIWDGLQSHESGKSTQHLCNGLIADWVKWQTSNSYAEHYEALVRCLRVLSPSEHEPLEPGSPRRVPRDSREMPTLQMPYGEVPILQASAAVQRVAALAYILVWTWREHVAICEMRRRHPQRRMVLMVDEVESHLHPQWQRVIIPGIMEVVDQLSSEIKPQIHIATHSPLVMASAETVFDNDQDQLHHLKLEQNQAVLEDIQFVKRGTADAWLMSEVFGLRHARSVRAEQVIEAAKELQLESSPRADSIQQIDDRLISVLAPDDPFWPRWRNFALQHGVDR